MTAATIQGIKSIPYIPRKGEHYLSVNLAMVDPAKFWRTAEDLGFQPELVQVNHRFGIEVHALLLFEQTNGDPLETHEWDDRIDQLAERINPDAIRHTYGGRLVA